MVVLSVYMKVVISGFLREALLQPKSMGCQKLANSVNVRRVESNLSYSGLRCYQLTVLGSTTQPVKTAKTAASFRRLNGF